MSSFDAVLLLSFGGPEAPEQVMPFLERVTAGRGIPPERLVGVAKQYNAFGGVSPINEQNRVFRQALEAALNLNVPPESVEYLPVYWGNRNWDPLLADTLAKMRDDRIEDAAVVITSGYSSYSGCRQYRENLYDAVTEIGAAAEESLATGSVAATPRLHKIRRWFDQPAFIEVMADNVVAAIGRLPESGVAPRLVFTTHSIPTSTGETSGDPAYGGNMYVRQHEFGAETIAAAASAIVGEPLEWDLVFQSRSGPPSMPWLEPDVNDFLAVARDQGTTSVVLIPIGFASDHMEVMWDLDTEAMKTAADLGINATRASTVGDDPRFVGAIARMVRERELDVPMADRVALGPWGPAPDACPLNCCPNPRGERPALCGARA
ncbi:MAG: ferrochelatase [Actinomycetes bacterium]|jgi:ferrochelatase